MFGALPRYRGTSWVTLILLGFALYGLSLLWPIWQMSPPWLAFPLAVAGVAVLRWSLRTVWTAKKPRPGRG